MLRASISFFLIGLIAYILGAYNIAGLSVEIGRMLLLGFFVLAILGFVGALVLGKKISGK